MSSSRRTQRASLLLAGGLTIVAASCWWLRADASPPTPMAAPSAAAALVPAHDLGTATAPGISGSPATDATGPPRTTATPRAPQLTGRLVQRGQPLANVRLRLYQTVRYMPTATDQTVTTAADGTFATAGLPTGFWLRADAPSVPFDWESIHQAPVHADRDLGDVEPPPAIALDLLVVDTTGRPVPKPRCWLARAEIQVDLDPLDARAPRRVTGDANGRAHLDRLHPGNLYLKVTAPGFAMVQKVVDLDAAPTPTPLQVTLTRGSRLHGRVFDWRGQPLPGAVASAEGQQIVTDAAGTFVFAAYGGAEALHVEAKGHEDWWSRSFGQEADFSHIQLQRTVALHGVVRGGNAATSIVLAGAPNVQKDVPWPGPNEKLACLLPVAADGTFSIDDLVPSDFVVHARSEGLGASLGQRVALRGDAAVELTIDPAARIALTVVDAEGHPVEPIEVVCNLAIVEYPSLFGPYATDIPTRVFDAAGRLTIPSAANRVLVPAPRDEPLALGVRSPGFLQEVRTFAAGEAPQQLTIVLQRGGVVRGVVRGGGNAFLRQVSLWTAEQDAKVRARQAPATTLAVDAQGRFASGTLGPGDYLATVHRYGRARIGKRADEQLGAVPLVDEGEDLRAVVRFAVVGGTTTTIELSEPALGTLRGRVLLSGRACPGAWVVAARPAAKLFEGVAGSGEAIDWNNEIDLMYVAGQRSGADGSFAFLYRDAGPVEVRVRPANGAATMPPVVVDLPPPGDPVFRDLEVALGGIRGRFVGAGADAPRDRPSEAVLFPLAKATADPFFSTDWAPSLASNCKRCDLDQAGNFVFSHVPDGEWLVRVTNGFNALFAQRLATVGGGETDLGELRAPASVTARIAWHWAPKTPTRQVYGVWLYEARGSAPEIWNGTHAATADGAECSRVLPGRYLGVVFGRVAEGDAFAFYGTFGEITGDALSKPFAIEVRSDGSCVPATIELVPETPVGR